MAGRTVGCGKPVNQSTQRSHTCAHLCTGSAPASSSSCASCTARASRPGSTAVQIAMISAGQPSQSAATSACASTKACTHSTWPAGRVGSSSRRGVAVQARRAVGSCTRPAPRAHAVRSPSADRASPPSRCHHAGAARTSQNGDVEGRALMLVLALDVGVSPQVQLHQRLLALPVLLRTHQQAAPCGCFGLRWERGAS